MTCLLHQAFSYFCTILLKLEDSVKGPYITENSIGVVMVGINVPLAVYFLYDITSDIQEHFAKLREEGLLQPGALSSRNLVAGLQRTFTTSTVQDGSADGQQPSKA